MRQKQMPTMKAQVLNYSPLSDAFDVFDCFNWYRWQGRWQLKDTVAADIKRALLEGEQLERALACRLRTARQKESK
jgi:hypothetical protein